MPLTVPQQPNSNDCGVYVMKFADFIIREFQDIWRTKSISFEHAEIKKEREIIIFLLNRYIFALFKICESNE